MDLPVLEFNKLTSLSLEEILLHFPQPPIELSMIPANKPKRLSMLPNPLATASPRSTSPSSSSSVKIHRSSSVPLDLAISASINNITSLCVGDLNPAQRTTAYQQLLLLDENIINESLPKIYGSFLDQSLSNLPTVPSDHSPSSPAEKKKSSFSIKKALTKSKSSKGFFAMPLKHSIDFGLRGAFCPLKEEMTDEVVIQCTESGVFKKKTETKIQFKLIVSTTTLIEEVVSIEMENLGRFFIVLRLQSEKSLFGEDVSRYMIDGKPTVPTILSGLKEYLVENGGLSVPEIFRQGCDEYELLKIKDQINRDIFENCNDIHIISNLIKSWFRELPEPLLQSISESILLTADGDDLLSLSETLKQPQRMIFQWLLDLCSDVLIAQQGTITAKSLAFVFSSSNLYTPKTSDPEKLQQIPTKIVNLLTFLVTHRTKVKESGGR